MYDKFNRAMKNLRISITHDCSYTCLYCHREGWNNRYDDILSPGEIGIISSVARSLDIDEFKLTGGEPLLRKDVIDIVEKIAEVKPKDLSMTTNGFLLKDFAKDLSEAGLMRVNVSLPSLNRERYRIITGIDGLENVLKGIDEAYNYNLKPITLNVVLLRDINDNEYKDFIEFAQRYEAKVRFIELEPIVLNTEVFNKLYVSIDNIVKYLEERSVCKVYRELNMRPIYILDNGIKVEIVKWLENKYFCRYCNRVRLSPEGVLKPCVMVKYGIDLKPFLRPDIDFDKLKEAFIKINQMRFPYNEIVCNGYKRDLTSSPP